MSLPALLLSPFQFDFMITAMMTTTLLAVPCALLSCFLVLKGWALMGDAMSHAVFPGVVLAWAWGLPLGIGAFVAGLLCALATGYLQENSRIKRDTILGIVFCGMFAVGLLLYVWLVPDVHLDHILFGDALGVSWHDLRQTAIIVALVSAIVLLKWRDLLLYAFDPVQAQVCGLNIKVLNYGLLCLTSLTIVACLKAVGSVLSVSLLIAPGAIASLLTRTFLSMMITAVVIATSCAFLGAYLSFFIDSAPAPTIVVSLSGVFLFACIWSGCKQRAPAADSLSEPSFE